MISVKLLRNAIMPVRATLHAAGYDLFACENIIIPGGQRRLITTNVIMAIPNGFYGRIAPRSGLAYKNGIDVLAGVIDSDYRKEIGVILYNTSNEDFFVKSGDRIAQIILTPIFTPELIEGDLEFTTRGGFGSTGK